MHLSPRMLACGWLHLKRMKVTYSIKDKSNYINTQYEIKHVRNTVNMISNFGNLFIIVCFFDITLGCKHDAKSTISLSCSPINDTLRYLKRILDEPKHIHSMYQYDIELEFGKALGSGNMQIDTLSLTEMMFKIPISLPVVKMCQRFVSLSSIRTCQFNNMDSLF